MGGRQCSRSNKREPTGGTIECTMKARELREKGNDLFVILCWAECGWMCVSLASTEYVNVNALPSRGYKVPLSRGWVQDNITLYKHYMLMLAGRNVEMFALFSSIENMWQYAPLVIDRLRWADERHRQTSEYFLRAFICLLRLRCVVSERPEFTIRVSPQLGDDESRIAQLNKAELLSGLFYW